MTRTRLCASCALLSLLVHGTCLPAHADTASMVSTARIEGIPYAAARQIDARAVAELAAVLRQPERSRDHARALRLLGISGHPGAFEAVLQYAIAAPSGPVSSGVFNARVSLRHAMGYLAHDDDRALDWLLSPSETLPTWSYASYRGAHLSRVLRRAAFRGLALSGRNEAHERIEACAEDPLDPELIRQSATLIELHRRVRQLGPERALSESQR